MTELNYSVLYVVSDNDLFETPGDYAARFARDGIRLVPAGVHGAPAETATLAPDADGILMGSGRFPASDELFDALPRCRVILRMGAGYDNVDVPSATRHGIVVSNMPGNIPEEVADHTIALFLACLRRLPQQDRAVRAGNWEPILAAPARRLAGQTMGFVGFGRIARLVSKKMSGFGLRYLAFDPYVNGSTMACLGVESVGFDDLLRRSDVVTLHAPATPETRNMFDARAFSLMKPSAILINTARGFLIEEQALCAALSNGRLRCAGLDVFQDEPIHPHSPLLHLDNVLTTPHVAGYSIEGLEDFFALGHQLLRDCLIHGNTPRWILNPEVLPAGGPEPVE